MTLHGKHADNDDTTLCCAVATQVCIQMHMADAHHMLKKWITFDGLAALELGLALVARACVRAVSDEKLEFGVDGFCSILLLMSGIGASAAGLRPAPDLRFLLLSKGSFSTGQDNAGRVDLGDEHSVVEFEVSESRESLLSIPDWLFGVFA